MPVTMQSLQSFVSAMCSILKVQLKYSIFESRVGHQIHQLLRDTRYAIYIKFDCFFQVFLPVCYNRSLRLRGDRHRNGRQKADVIGRNAHFSDYRIRYINESFEG